MCFLTSKYIQVEYTYIYIVYMDNYIQWLDLFGGVQVTWSLGIPSTKAHPPHVNGALLACALENAREMHTVKARI